MVEDALVVPETDTDAGLNVAEPPLGRPVAVSVTDPVNPLGVTVISVDFEVPFDMLKLDGLALKLILPVGGAGELTTSVTDVV
jgi:hypothetical protein